MFTTYFKLFNPAQKYRNHANETFSSDSCLICMKLNACLILVEMSYSHDFELFKRNFISRVMFYFHDIETLKRNGMAQNMSHTYDFETHKNLSHKQSVLFY